jgi:hypothetical protein
MHIYAFGSICRGDVTPGSDIDLLAVTEGHDPRFELATYSIYSYARLREIWEEGNPFAWHLYLESRLLFADNASDFLRSLGAPRPYRAVEPDCEKFVRLFIAARDAVENGTNSIVFELSTLFLALRNFATCFSLGRTEYADFSRRSALRLGTLSLSIDPRSFETLERARILSTRGVGEAINDADVQHAISSFDGIQSWMNVLSARTRSP